MLQKRLFVWTLLTASVPAILYVALFDFMVGRELRESVSRQHEVLVQSLVTSLTGHIGPDAEARSDEVLDTFAADPGAGFVVVTNARNQELFKRIFSESAWQSFDANTLKMHGDSPFEMTRVAINPPRAPNAAAESAEKQRKGVDGFLLIARRPGLSETALARFTWAQVGAFVLLMLIAWPVSNLFFRRWTRSLEELMQATQRLAKGLPPTPVAVTSNDEWGFLASTFNDMAASLLGSHRKLIETNSELEDRIGKRTDELQKAVMQLNKLASTDALTGLANRRVFTEALTTRFTEASLHEKYRNLAVMMIDLDGFKGVNDTYGHERGDELLILTGKSIEKHIRPRDLVARLGGDEFVILMPSTDLEDARAVGDSIRLEFEEESRKLFTNVTPPPKVSMSQGVANVLQTRPDSSDEFLAQADSALYTAKERGKSCLEVFVPPPADAAIEVVEQNASAPAEQH